MDELALNSAIPLYKQLADKVRTDYVYNVSNIDTVGPIPSEKELMQKYSVSRITVRNAVNELVKEGFLQKTQGKGTFVTGKKGFPMNHGGGFSNSCHIMGVKPSTKLISMEKVVPPAEEREFFSFKKGEKILRIKRLRLGDGQPLLLERLYLPTEYAQLTREELEGSFYALMKKRFGMIINKGPWWIEIYRATVNDALLMEIEEGDPLILTRECAYDPQGRPLHSTKLLINSTFRFHFQ